MSYTNNIPTVGQSLGASRPLILNNFNLIQTAFAVDHVDFNLSPLGYHKVIHFNTNSGNPAVVPLVGQLYTKTVSGDQQLFFKTGSNGVSQLTGASASTNGYQFLGSVLMQWGQASKATGGVVTFPLAFGSGPFSVQCTVLQNDNNRHFVQVKSVTTTNFTLAVRDSAGNDETVTFSWMAIGVLVL